MAAAYCRHVDPETGEPCKRRLRRACQRYCDAHAFAAAASDVALPGSFVAVGTEKFSVYTADDPNWRVLPASAAAGAVLGAFGSRRLPQYSIAKKVSEGTYGNVYFGCRVGGSALPVAIKISKAVYRRSDTRYKEPSDYDFLKEIYVHRAISGTVPGGDWIVVRLVDAFFVRSRGGGLHGCQVMERMDGDLRNVFGGYLKAHAASNPGPAYKLWLLLCLFLAKSLCGMHDKHVYHLDVKAANVLYCRTMTDPGIALKLVDLGFACCPRGAPAERVPKIPGYAVGTYIPPEWREPGSDVQPTFDRVDDEEALRLGDYYSTFVTLHKTFRRIEGPVQRAFGKDNGLLARMLDAIERGRSDDPKARAAVDLRHFASLAAEALREQAAGYDASLAVPPAGAPAASATSSAS